jgi:O-antigen/teichoic acid export membrane protein
MIAMRWSIRLVGLLSVVVLARILDKRDFGVVAVATSIAALPVAILELGLETAIIRDTASSPGVYNTAWTIRALQMTFAAAGVYVSGAWLAHFYGDLRIAKIIPVLALSIWIQGLENTWLVSFRKNLNYKIDFAFNASIKVVTAVTTIVLAIHMGNYWALVYGQITGAVYRVLFSFAVAPKFPRLTLSHWRELWSFSQWSLVRSLADYTAANVDRLILGRVGDTGQVGAYSLGREIADVPISEISAPVNRALGPGFAKLLNEPKRLADALVKSVGAVATIACPVGLGLAATSQYLVPLLLGKGWEGAIPVVQILALSSLVTAMRGVLGYTLTVIGLYRSVAILMWVRAAMLIVVGIPASISAGPIGMAATFSITELVACLLQTYYFRRYFPEFRFSSLGLALVRPGLSSLVMFGFVVALSTVSLQSHVTQLVCQATVGALVYTALLLLFWQYAGRPDGPESMLIGQLRSAWHLVHQP